MCAPEAVTCAYMALEDWAFQELERERPLDGLVQQIVAGSGIPSAGHLRPLLR
jgi:hypothetical protein